MNTGRNTVKILLFLSLAIIMGGKELRVMTYNIFGARLANGEKLGKSIKKYKPDFISLQEVDRNTGRSKFRDVTSDIAEQLGYDYYYFQKSRDFDKGEFGISFISKYPVEKIYTYELPSEGVEKRQIVIAEIKREEFGKSIMIANTHLDFKEEMKSRELESIFSILKMKESEIKFLSGDLNILPATYYYNMLMEEWKDSYFEGSRSDRRTTEDSRIDYILGNKTENWKVKKSFFINDKSQEWTKLSDHLPYMSIFDIK